MTALRILCWALVPSLFIAIIYFVITNKLVTVTDYKLTFSQYIICSLFFIQCLASAMVRVQFVPFKIVACICHTVTVELKMPMGPGPKYCPGARSSSRRPCTKLLQCGLNIIYNFQISKGD